MSVVRRPIDLSTIARRLRRGTYDNAAGRLRRDVLRIFKNCEKFHRGSSQLFVNIARELTVLFEAEWAEADLPIPGETQAQSLRTRATLRAARYKLCWAAALRGPLLEAARKAVQAAAEAALKVGGRGAADVQQRLGAEVLPLLLSSGEDRNAENRSLTLGSFVRCACSALGLRPDQAPTDAQPAAAWADGSADGGDAVDANGAIAGINDIAEDSRCAEWLFGPRQSAWLSAETAARNHGVTVPVASATVAAWRVLDAVLSPATVLVAARASRGTEFSSVWARPDCLVWARQAKNCFWPAMLLWGSKTNPALKEVNKGRVPPAFREELDKQARNYRGAAGSAVVEFFGSHEFALLKPDALRSLSTLGKCPNKTISKNKRWEPTMEEAVRGVAALQALDSAIDQPQPQRARDLGFTADTAGNEQAMSDSDTGTSSGESVLVTDDDNDEPEQTSPQQPSTPASTPTAASTPTPPSASAAANVVTGATGGGFWGILSPNPVPTGSSSHSNLLPPAQILRPTTPTPTTPGGDLDSASVKPKPKRKRNRRLALKRPREEMTKKERALDCVVRYMSKFGDQFLRPAQRAALAAAREKEKAMYRARGQLPPSAPRTVAAATVLGQTGLWGTLMGGPETTKAQPQETESTDDED
ncbi:unnamed protein product, partial [Sphacelaria rigidula]